jgi:proline dehydrogenase
MRTLFVERRLSRHRDARPGHDRSDHRPRRPRGIAKEAFEFQMLYGVRRDLQVQLARDGYNMRVYVPYGKHWYPYFMRRLAERPANVWFVLKNMLKG